MTPQDGAAPRWVRYTGHLGGCLPGVITTRWNHSGRLTPFFATGPSSSEANCSRNSPLTERDEYANPFSFWITRDLAEKTGGFFATGVECRPRFPELGRGDWLRPAARRGGASPSSSFSAPLRDRPVRAQAFPRRGGVDSVAALLASGHFIFSSRKSSSGFPWLILMVQLAVALAWSVVSTPFSSTWPSA
jgi:hypothetical protein